LDEVRVGGGFSVWVCFAPVAAVSPGYGSLQKRAYISSATTTRPGAARQGRTRNQMVPGTVGGRLETTVESQLSLAGNEGDF
jgi:hypothetical protein